MKKYPMMRVKQFLNNPTFAFFWLQRLFYFKKHSFDNVSSIASMKQYSVQETLAHLINTHSSIIRFGDGEFGILSGGGIFQPDSDWSQRYSKGLKATMKRQLVLKHPKILIAIPPKAHLLYKEGDQPVLDVISSMHTEARMYLPEYLDQSYRYGDWSVFMPHHHPGMDWQKVKQYFADKTIVIVTGGTEKLSDITLGKETLFVECGKHDAFARQSDILKRVDILINEKKLIPEETLFLISLGCTAGVVVEHLVGRGYTGWDTGHIFRYARKQLSSI